METSKILSKLEEWKAQQEHFQAAYKLFRDAFGAEPDAPAMDPLFKLWDAYTAAIGELVGDGEDWLSWYEYECDMGERPKEVSFPDGREIVVATLEDLAGLIAAIRAGEWAICAGP